MSSSLVRQLAAVVGHGHLNTDTQVLAARSVDHTGRYRGRAAALVRPADTQQVTEVLRCCRDAGAFVTIQGGRTSLVAGTVPEHDDVLLATDRLVGIGEIDTTEARVRVGAGVTAAALHRAAAAAGLLFGVDLASRDSATIGGMAATNAGGLRTVRYGNMAEQTVGLTAVLPDSSVLQRHSSVLRDATGYDLTRLLVGAEGTLGVITEVDVRLHRISRYRIAALAGFTELATAIAAARVLRDVESIAALELIDTGVLPKPSMAPWLLLVELAADTDPTDQLAQLLESLDTATDPAVGTDAAGRQRLWSVRESVNEAIAAVGAPLKFDVSLPLSQIDRFATQATELIIVAAPEAIPVLFGHIGEGNMHLNVLRVPEQAEPTLYAAMMELITTHGGNVSSEHGVGSRKRRYLSMARSAADIAAMRAIKATFDPTGYLNPAVLFARR